MALQSFQDGIDLLLLLLEPLVDILPLCRGALLCVAKVSRRSLGASNLAPNASSSKALRSPSSTPSSREVLRSSLVLLQGGPPA